MKRSPTQPLIGVQGEGALAAVKGDQTLAQLAECFDVDPHQITQWKARLLERAMEVFATPGERRGAEGPSLKNLQAKIGQLAMENDFLAGALGRIDDASAKR